MYSSLWLWSLYFLKFYAEISLQKKSNLFVMFYVMFSASSREWHFCWPKQRLISTILYICQDIVVNLFQKRVCESLDERYLYLWLVMIVDSLNALLFIILTKFGLKINIFYQTPMVVKLLIFISVMKDFNEVLCNMTEVTLCWKIQHICKRTKEDE